MRLTSKAIGIVNTSKNAIVGSDIRVATTAWSRLVGLLGEAGLDPGGGLFIVPSSGVHTWGMRFPIDVVALDRRMRVLGHLGASGCLPDCRGRLEDTECPRIAGRDRSGAAGSRRTTS